MGYKHNSQSILSSLPITGSPRPPPAQLTAPELEHAGQMRIAVHQHMPEILPAISELVAMGMIDGWRNVVEVEVYKDPRYESDQCFD